MIGEDGPGGVEAWIRRNSFDGGGEVSDGVQLGVSVIVLGDKFKADLRLLVSKVDRDCLGQVEERVGVRDYCGSYREYDVADLDYPGLPLSPADEEVLTTSEREEQGPRQ